MDPLLKARLIAVSSVALTWLMATLVYTSPDQPTNSEPAPERGLGAILTSVQEDISSEYGVELSNNEIRDLNCNIPKTRFGMMKCYTEELLNGGVKPNSGIDNPEGKYGSIEHEGVTYTLYGVTEDGSFRVAATK